MTDDSDVEYYFGVPFKKRVSAPATATAAAEPKFKVGDRVRTDGGYSFDPSVGTVCEVAPHHYGVRLDVKPDYTSQDVWSYCDEDLSLAHTFTAGDRVRLTRNAAGFMRGDRGTVDWDGGRIGVVMDGRGVYRYFDADELEAADCEERNGQRVAKPKFRAGDVVTYADDDSVRNVIKGVRTHDHTGRKYEGGMAYDYEDGGWDWETSLELVISGNQPAIVALVKNGQPRPADRPYVHASVEAATTEAERLARNNPGQEFAVYQRVGARVAEVSYQMKEVV